MNTKLVARMLSRSASEKKANAFTSLDEVGEQSSALQQLVGDPDVDPVSWTAQFRPGDDHIADADPNSPTGGDDTFFHGLHAGARFQDKNGTQWDIEQYGGEADITIQNVWYPDIELTTSIQAIRKSIHAWIEPIYQLVPPAPKNVDYGVAVTRIVD